MSRLTLVALLLVPALVAQDAKESPLITKLKGLKMKGPFTLLVSLEAKKGEEKALMDLARPCVEATRKEKGCVAYDLQQNLEKPTKFVLYERWKSVEALKEHLEQEYTKKLLGEIGKLVEGPMSLEMYQFAEDR